MRIPGLKRKTEEPALVEPAFVLTPLQELLKAENEVSLVQGRIDQLNKEFWEFTKHFQVIEDSGQYVGILNQAALSAQCTELHVQQQFYEFHTRKNELLKEFHAKLAAWAELKQRTAQSVEHVIALPTLPPA